MCSLEDTSFRPFPLAALPEPSRSFVKIGARAIGCDESYVALPLLAALAAAIGNTRRVELKRGWCEPAVLWAAIVGESGTLKSPAIDLSLKWLRERQAEALREHERAMADYEAACEAYKARRFDLKAKNAKDGTPPPEPPEKPVCKRYWCSDTTTEALADRLSTAPRGLLLVRDELAGWLRSFNQYKGGKGGDEAHWLEMHRAGNLLVDRKTGDKSVIFVPRAAVCVTGGIQPEVLRRCLTPDFFESGLAARFLLAMPPRKVKRWTDAEVPGQLEARMEQVFDRLLGLLPDYARDGEPYPVDVPLSEPALSEWKRFFDEHAREQAELVGDMSAAWAKLEGYAARLALVSHFVRWAAEDPAFGREDALDAESVEAGVVLARWFGREAQRVYGVLGESGEEREHREVVEVVQRKGGRLTARDLQRCCRKYGTAADAEAALRNAAAAGLLVLELVPATRRGGRPTDVFRLPTSAEIDATHAVHTVSVDSVDADTTARIPEENEVVSTAGSVNGPEPRVGEREVFEL